MRGAVPSLIQQVQRGTYQWVERLWIHNNFSRIFHTRGGGGGVTKPAVIHSKFSKRENNKHSRGGIQGAESRSNRGSDSNLNLNTILTPTKRKLIQNCNTGNLLKIFEAKTEVQTGIDVVGEGGAEVDSPAKRRRCCSTRLSHRF